MAARRPVVFVDTFILVAAIDARDARHDEAEQLLAEFDAASTRLVTTDAILIELANYFARSPLRVKAIQWIDVIRAQASWEVVPLEPALVARGEARYRRFADKAWSLTDCISMEVMQQRGIREIATRDHHFKQAGFQVLPA